MYDEKESESVRVWKNMWEERVNVYHGRMVEDFDTRFDGKDYHFVSRWDEDSDMESFLDVFSGDVCKSAQDIDDGYLTLYFSVKGGPDE